MIFNIFRLQHQKKKYHGTASRAPSPFQWNNIKRKINAIISEAVARLGTKINFKTLKSIYYSYVNSHLSYLIPIWGTSTPSYLLNSIQVTQNHAIRRIFYREYNIKKKGINDIIKKYLKLSK